jgi:hypothetical protein
MKDAVLAVITVLKADTAIAALVGTRVYKDIFPSSWSISSGSAIVVPWIDGIRDKANSTGKYAKTRIQITIAAATGTAAKNLSDLVANALSNLEGTVQFGVYLVDVDDAGERPDNSDAVGLGIYRVNHDFMITYSFI